MSGTNQPLVFVDIEIACSQPGNSYVLEVGAIRVETGRAVSVCQSLLSQANLVPASITQLTGVTTADVASLFREFKLNQSCVDCALRAHGGDVSTSVTFRRDRTSLGEEETGKIG